MATERRRQIMAMATTALLALASTPASAHDFKVDSRVSIRYSDGAFSGKVNSSKRFCEKWRKIKLYKFSGGHYEVVRRDKTNRDGEWRIPYDGLGAFYAVAVYKEKVVQGHSHKCNKAQSDFTQP